MNLIAAIKRNPVPRRKVHSAILVQDKVASILPNIRERINLLIVNNGRHVLKVLPPTIVNKSIPTSEIRFGIKPCIGICKVKTAVELGMSTHGER